MAKGIILVKNNSPIFCKDLNDCYLFFQFKERLLYQPKWIIIHNKKVLGCLKFFIAEFPDIDLNWVWWLTQKLEIQILTCKETAKEIIHFRTKTEYLKNTSPSCSNKYQKSNTSNYRSLTSVWLSACSFTIFCEISSFFSEFIHHMHHKLHKVKEQDFLIKFLPLLSTKAPTS